jgi:hypothetical protein
MPTSVTVIAFLAGSLFVLIALVGGGVEVKELRVPRIGAGPRIGAFMIGALFIGVGLAPAMYDGLRMLAHDAAESGPSSLATADTAATAPSAASGTGATDGTVSSSFREDPWAGISAATTDTTAVTATTDTFATAPAAETGFAGFDGQWRVQWTVQGVTYVGDMKTSGQWGTADVSYLDENGNAERVIEDLRLIDTGKDWYYAGSNPRVAATLERAPTYEPDYFHISGGPGNWTVDRACDRSACYAATVGGAD